MKDLERQVYYITMINDEEVSIAELMDKYMITSDGMTSTGFTKNIIMSDKDNQYVGRLHWDSHNGYSMGWDGKEPPEACRPEFEYVLDCITDLDRK